jgi:glutathione S-transferase
MAAKLHCCSLTFLKIGAHPCWRVQKALDEAGVEYEIVKHPLSKGRRDELKQKTGQRLLPAIELEDGTVIRDDSAALAARIRAGELAWQAADR